MMNSEDHKQQLEARITQLEQQLQRTENERQNGLIALENERKRYQRERETFFIDILRKMGRERFFILDMLEILIESKSSSATVLTARDVLYELKRWIRDISGQKLTRFPSATDAPDGRIVLSASELTNPDNGFDVGNERPFASGNEQVTFKIIRRGWRLGSTVLYPARLAAWPPLNENLLVD